MRRSREGARLVPVTRPQPREGTTPKPSRRGGSADPAQAVKARGLFPSRPQAREALRGGARATNYRSERTSRKFLEIVPSRSRRSRGKGAGDRPKSRARLLFSDVACGSLGFGSGSLRARVGGARAAVDGVFEHPLGGQGGVRCDPGVVGVPEGASGGALGRLLVRVGDGVGKWGVGSVSGGVADRGFAGLSGVRVWRLCGRGGRTSSRYRGGWSRGWRRRGLG